MSSIHKILFFIFILTINYTFCQAYPKPIQDSSSKIDTVYLIKSRWHTGIIMSVNDISLKNIRALNLFKDRKYVDIGWGDADFYQSPKDFDVYLAFKALFIPTESVVRIEGYDCDIKNIIEWSDFCIEFELHDRGFIGLCKFIDSSLSKTGTGRLIVTSTRDNNRIIFFKSDLKYYIFETCNKWVAEAFESAGFRVSPKWIITAENLFNEIKKFGTVLKFKK
jgi:hypothetical protein